MCCTEWVGKLIIFTMMVFLASVVVVGAEEDKSVTRTKFVELKKQTREEFAAKMQEIKDQRKKELVSRLNNQLCEVQKKRVEANSKQLETMAMVVAKLTTKLGGNTNVAVMAASKAIDTAKEAVAQLAVKPCGINLTGTEESKVRADTQTARVALEADIKIVQEKVKTARKLTGEAVKSVGKSLREIVPTGVKE